MEARDHAALERGCRMISGTPYYIILGECGIAVALALAAIVLRRRDWRIALAAGLAAGGSIFICYARAFTLTDGLFPR